MLVNFTNNDKELASSIELNVAFGSRKTEIVFIVKHTPITALEIIFTVYMGHVVTLLQREPPADSDVKNAFV